MLNRCLGGGKERLKSFGNVEAYINPLLQRKKNKDSCILKVEGGSVKQLLQDLKRKTKEHRERRNS